MKFKVAGLVLGVLLCANSPVNGFSSSADKGGNIHEGITREALSGTISDTNLKFLIKAIDSQDAADGASESRRHFGDSSFSTALAYMDREKKKALNYAAEADLDAQSRTQALRHFGMMLHTAQDFYSQTNYVELQLEDPAKLAHPYDIDLVDWTRVPDGYFGSKSGDHLVSSTAAVPCNKGNIAINFKVARELAVKETQRQWNLFEVLIRARCHARANAVIDALKQAGLAEGASPDSLPDLGE